MKQVIELRRVFDGFESLDSAFGTGVIFRGVLRDNFLYGDCFPFAHLDTKILSDITFFNNRLTRYRNVYMATHHTRTRRLGNTDFGLTRLHLQEDIAIVFCVLLQRDEMPMIELAVAFDAKILHRTIKGRPHLHRSGPVVCGDGQFNGGKVGKPHMNEPAFFDCRLPAMRVSESIITKKKTFFDVQLLAKTTDIDSF